MNVYINLNDQITLVFYIFRESAITLENIWHTHFAILTKMLEYKNFKLTSCSTQIKKGTMVKIAWLIRFKVGIHMKNPIRVMAMYNKKWGQFASIWAHNMHVKELASLNCSVISMLQYREKAADLEQIGIYFQKRKLFPLSFNKSFRRLQHYAEPWTNITRAQLFITGVIVIFK